MKRSDTCLITCRPWVTRPTHGSSPSSPQPSGSLCAYICIIHTHISIKLDDHNSIFVDQRKPDFILSLIGGQVHRGEMAGLMDKAKDFVAEKVANMKKPEATVKNVDLKDVSCECITYKADVNVSNPYSTAIPICEISYTFKSADRVIAEGNIPDPGSLKADGDTMLDVGVKVPHSVLASLVRDIGADWDIDYELNIILTVDLPVIGNINIPVNSKGEIKLPTLSSLFGSK